MNPLFQIEKEFQTSVNIGYDLNNPKKIQSFIPTTAAIDLLEDIMLSTDDSSTKRARLLIGAYGKGKSHIILVILSILCQKRPKLYDALIKKVREQKPELFNYIFEYFSSNKKLLPVIIDGNSASLTQSFLGALYRTLNENGLSNIMPETHFRAALNMIGLWKQKYPATFEKMKALLNESIDDFVDHLKQYDVNRYDTFIKIYPQLTSGSEFNPFAGFSIVDIYDSVNQKLKEYGYTGIYVVYDEFSKYLEANIASASVSDVKMLQDFAEKCNRSGSQQLHLLLILHKEIENYIDQLPKQKVDGWRGVSERFSHIVLHSDYSQVYEIIAHALKKNPKYWNDFRRVHSDSFSMFKKIYNNSGLFRDLGPNGKEEAIYGCYPLHPVTTFMLPRISEKIAQNERTMFTFLSGNDHLTLSYILQNNNEDFPIVTPDVLYDYFELQMKKEAYITKTHQIYKLAAHILQSHELSDIEKKLVKTIALIYILEQFEKISPTIDTLIDLYGSDGYTSDEVSIGIKKLINEQCVVYLKRSNAYLKLKESSGVNVIEEINKLAEKRKNDISLVQTLNQINEEPYLYPNQYNERFEMTRYFRLLFVPGRELLNNQQHYEAKDADGIVIGIIPEDDDVLEALDNQIRQLSINHLDTIYALPRKLKNNLNNICHEFDACSFLREESYEAEDKILFDEYDVIYQDLFEVIHSLIQGFIHPEKHLVRFYYNGIEERIFRKSQLTNKMSSICESIYPDTPIVNNEMLNKNILTVVAKNSRTKLLNGILNNITLPNLGLSGTGQEISFMRSTLKQTRVLSNLETNPTFDPHVDERVKNVLKLIQNFVEQTKGTPGMNIGNLYEDLMGPKNKIGMRKGIIPIFLALVLLKYKGHVIIKDQVSEVPLSAETLNRMNEAPKHFTLMLEDWTDEKQEFIEQLRTLFEKYVPANFNDLNGYGYIVEAMERWYLSLPKYVKEAKKQYVGAGDFSDISRNRIKFLSLLKQPGVGAQEILFHKISQCFGFEAFNDQIYKEVKNTKEFFDQFEGKLESEMIADIKEKLAPSANSLSSLSSIAKDWLNSIPEAAKNHLYPDGAERLIRGFDVDSNNDFEIIEQLAYKVSGLHINDWNDYSIVKFFQNIDSLLKTIKNYVDFLKNQPEQAMETNSNQLEPDFYEISIAGSDGIIRSKSFKKEAYSKRAKLLKNEITASLEEMGQSITPAEKRQVLIDILQKLL